MAEDQASIDEIDSSPPQQTPAALSRLQYIQDVLTQKLAERRRLGERIEAANEQDKADLRKMADDVTVTIRQLRTTLESLAIGNVDTSLFVEQAAEESSDWQKDIMLIAQPVIDSLKELTEKPRKLKELNDIIKIRQQELEAANLALHNLKPALNNGPDGELEASLNRLINIWERRRDDARSAMEIARFQIADIRGDKSLTQSLADAFLSFLSGRGLTIALAVAAASVVWFSVRFLLRGYRATLARGETPESRTRYRLAAYSVHALTGVLILIAIFVVFYQRGDVLLLGLLILLIVGLALGVRQLLPHYVREARLLLNIGPMREAERIIYRGIPWRVEAINMNTILRNPELHGILRIPLAEFHNIHSRPCGSDKWFPTSNGDIILFPDDQLLEVINQNPDTVELRERGGQIQSIPTSEFYSREMINLSRGEAFSVIGTFGIDYLHQSISANLVPKALRGAIKDALADTDLKPFIKDVLVELEQAGESSIDYWLFVSVRSTAAKSYLRIQRLMQSACIKVCTDMQWSIPYPHLSLVQKPIQTDV
ncbi:MAG: mechanosensitive ion channel [Granulosicoccus sp.]|nr:mechanosensitive ion channel [Granulosicoccus sp.]